MSFHLTFPAALSALVKAGEFSVMCPLQLSLSITCCPSIIEIQPLFSTKTLGGFMAKGKNTQKKADKKKSEKTLKEKRKEKKEKKAQKGKI